MVTLSAHTIYAGANYGLSLNGSSQYVSVPANSSLTPSPFTLEAWIKVPGAGLQTILSRGDGGNGSITDYILQLSNNGGSSGNEVSLFAGGAWDASVSSVPLNTWTHVAVTFDGRNKQFYINGVLDRTAPRTNSIYVTPGSPMYIGRQGSACNCNFFNGSIAEVRLWSTIRTAAQISADMNFSLAGSQPGLVAYYHLDEGSGTTAIDATGNGNTGTLQNGASWVNSGPPSLGTTNVLEGPAAGVESVVLASLGTSWTAQANASWLHLSAGYQSGTTSTNVVFSFDANTGATRTGTISIAGQTLSITQAASNYVAATPVTTLVSAGLNNPQGIAVDGTGNVYIADTGNNAIKVWWPASNTVTTLVSSGLNGPNGVAVDVAGNVYIADTTNNAIKEWVAASNSVTTLVSSGLNHPVAVAVDGVGNVYFADVGNSAVKEWSVVSHTVTILIPNNFVVTPTGVAVDGAGNVYATDTGTGAVMEWSAATHAADVLISGPGPVLEPNYVAVDGNGNLYLAGYPGSANEWAAATANVTRLFSSGVNSTVAVAVDGSRNVYICDTVHNAILEWSRAYMNTTPKWEPLAAGSDVLPVVLPATENLLPPFAPSTDQPWLNVTNVTNGVVSFTYAAGSSNRVGHISMLGQNITVLQFNDMLNTSVSYVGPAAGTNSVVLTVEPAAPQAWTATSQASWLHLPVSSGSGSATVSFTIDPNPGVARTATLTIGGQTLVVIQEPLALGWTARVEGPAAGADSVVLSSLGAPWTATANAPWLHLSAGNQSGTGNQNVVFTFDANTGATRTGTLTIAGMTLTVTQGGSNYVATVQVTTLAAYPQIAIPYGATVDGAGNVYIADPEEHQIKKWSRTDNSVSTLFSVDSASYPDSVALDAAGNVFISSYNSGLIQEWSPASNTVTTLFYSGKDYPEGVAVDGAGNVYASGNTLLQLLAANQALVNLPGNPIGLALDAAGNAYFSDYALMELPVGSQTVTTLVGGLPYARGVAVDGGGNVYVADNQNTVNAIMVFSPATQSVSTLPIGGLHFPESAAVDALGNVYAVDTDNSAIKELPRAFVDSTPRTESSVAGNDSLPMVLPSSVNLSTPFAPTSDQGWLTITGVTNGVVSFAFSNNPGGNRTGNITVLGQTIAVTQLTYIVLSANQRMEGPAAGTDSVFLTSLNNPWTATPNVPWLHLSATNQSGTTSANVVFTFDANPGPTRVGTITIAGQTLTVFQEAVSLAASTRLEGPAAGTDSILLRSVNAPWAATTNAPWLHLGAGYQSGTGSTNIIFSFDANPGATRTGTLTIAGLTLTITQAGSTYIAAPGPITLVSSNLNQIYGVAADGAGNVYIADYFDFAIKEWLVASNTVITLVTNGSSYPNGVAVDAAGNVYFDNTGNTLQAWSPVSGIVTVLVTNGLNDPNEIAVDGVGNVYLADRNSYTIKEWSATASNLTTLVSGLNYPQGVAVDFLGDVFIADTDNRAIKRWSVANGAVTTLVNSSGTYYPQAVAADAGANLYFVDQTGAIKEWSPGSTNLTTLFASPSDYLSTLAVDGAGDLYFADFNNRLHNYYINALPHAFVDPTAKFESLAAGSDVLPLVVPATQNLLGPFAPASDQPWLTITGVTNGVVSFAFTAATTNRTANINLLGQRIPVTQFSYLLNLNLVSVGPVSGSNSVGLMVSADVPQSWTASSQASWLHLVAASGSGSAVVGFTFDANPGAPRSGTLTIAGQVLTINQAALSLGESVRVEGPAAGSDSVVLSSFNSSWTVSTNAAWLHLTPANQSGTGSTNVIFSFDANTGSTRTGTLTVAGLPLAITQAGSNYVAATAVTTLVSSGLSGPHGVAVDSVGNVYIADTYNSAIKEWLVASNTVITLVTNGLNSPQGVAVDAAGNVYIADTGNNAVEEWNVASNTLTTLVSLGLSQPSGVAVDSLGNVYIADQNNGAVKEWSAASRTVATLLSNPNSLLYGVTVDSAGNVYVLDAFNLTVEKWSATSGSVTTLISSALNNPQGLAVDGAGNIYISDTFVLVWSAASNTVSTLRTTFSYGVAVDGAGNVYLAGSGNNIREIPRAFVNPTAKLESAAAGSDVLPVVLPATENLLAPFAPTNSQPWLTITGVTNGVVGFAFAFNPGAARTNTITLLGRPISVVQTSLPPPALISARTLGNGSFQIAFTNVTGASFSVWSTTNLSLPLSNWTSLGSAVEGPPGQYQFTDTAPTNSQRFYIVRFP